ncbi:MAG TPA: glycoside hydrolase family 3 C-terminal domain-containing protein, partial [Bryobacteraceae bacterium]|nr:glycoside hydrolase family 3 C-terminal domain-containing protein [Bryobacteraceae bacterium]
RGQETYGEDPFLAGQMGEAFVKGMQGEDPKYFKVIATPKHFAVHSGPEPSRHSIDVKVSLHDEEDTYLPAFRAAIVDGKADSVMCAYNSINGQPACVNQFLLQDTLRGAWHFNGYVTSDCGAIADISNPAPRGHGFVPTIADAAAQSLKRGDDLDCGADGTNGYLPALQKGLISQQDADTNLKRLFTARFKLGMFDPPSMVKYAQIPFSENDSAAHRELAHKEAREAIVLLKNDGTLPLKSSVKKIAVVGPLADSIPAIEGNYNGTNPHYVMPIDGIRQEFKNDQVTFTPGTSFLRAPVTIPATAYRTDAGQPGITAVYFNNKDLSGTPAATRTEEQLGFGGRGGGGRGAGAGMPEGVGQGDLSIRYTTNLKADDTNTYTLEAGGQGGVRVWLDGKLLIDDWVEHANAGGGRGFGAPADPAIAAARTKTVQLDKNKSYALKVEYFRSAPAAAPANAAGRGFGGRGGFGGGGATLSWRAGDTSLDSAVAAAKQADVVVAVVGITRELEGEEMRVNLEGFSGGDRTSLDLPKDEESLLEAVKGTGKPLVVVLMNGSALSVNWANQNANAIVESWYPGEEGGAAIAETLSGANNPAGRLPVTFYKSVNDLPPFDDYSMTNRTYRYFTGQPLYPFGYGLSYTKFAYSNAKLSTSSLKAGGNLTIDVDVKNTGGKDGDEVVQAYIEFPKLPGAPLKALRGFSRVSIAAGKTQHVKLTLDPRDLSMVNEAGTRLVAAGDYKIFVGGGQPG